MSPARFDGDWKPYGVPLMVSISPPLTLMQQFPDVKGLTEGRPTELYCSTKADLMSSCAKSSAVI